MPSASGQFRIVCPECHNEKRKCFVDGTGKGLHCKHCAWSSSWKAFLRRYEPPTPEEVALESFVTKAQKTLLETPALMKYLLDRGLSHETIQKARLGYFNSLDAVPTEADFSVGLAYPPHNWVLGEHIIIPYIRDGYVITVRGRNMTGNEAKKYMSLAHSNPGLYHTGPENFENPVYVGEGEFDALMLRQYGYQSVGSPGASYPMRDELLQYGRIYACFDGDAAGLQAVTKFKKELPEFYHVSLPDGMDVTDYINNFEADSFQSLVNNAVLYVDGKPQREDRLTKNVDDWSDWAWSNGELLGPRIGWAPRLEKSLSGWSTGLIVLGALPNSGKSCFFVKSAYECALANQEDTVAVYLSLDDDQEDALTRVVSLHTGLSFEEVRVPRWSFDHPTDPKRRDREKLEYFYKKLEELKRLDNLIIRDAKYGRSLTYICNFLSSLRRRYADKRLVVFIDSLAKITPDGSEGGAPNWKAYLAAELKHLSTTQSLCIITPADFRKLNDERRPTNDDLKDAAEIAYEANAVLLGFNEMNVKGDPWRVILKWSNPTLGAEEFPIFELNVSKNKKSLHKGAIRFRFYPPTSDFSELTEEEDRIFTDAIKNAPQAGGKAKANYNGTTYTAEATRDFTPSINRGSENSRPHNTGTSADLLQPLGSEDTSYLSSPSLLS